jgi:phosphate transport system substrate-binding protein
MANLGQKRTHRKTIGWIMVIFMAWLTWGTLQDLSASEKVQTSEDSSIRTQADAMRLLEQGNSLYRAGRYKEALEIYRKSYSITKDRRLAEWIDRLERSLNNNYDKIIEPYIEESYDPAIVGDEVREFLRWVDHSRSNNAVDDDEAYFIVSGDVTIDSALPPALGFSLSFNLSENLPRLDGATSFYPVYFMIGQEVYRGNEDWEKSLTLSRTEEAYNRLMRGETDVIFVLQPSDEQLRAAKDAGLELRLTPIAKEAFVFFVNERNPVSGLSIEQIQDIYQKKITNWKDLDGDDEEILAFQRPENSGSQTAMIKEVMKGKELSPPLQAEYRRGMLGIVCGVAAYREDLGAIGYSFRFFTLYMVQYSSSRNAYYRSPNPDPRVGHIKLLAIDGIAPTEGNIRNGTYPLTVDVFAATAGTKNPHAQELIDWILSSEGQALIERVGYAGVGTRQDEKLE